MNYDTLIYTSNTNNGFYFLSIGVAPVSAADLTLRYDKPAEDWEKEALPIGNGRMDALLFGGLPMDRVQFNEISLWTGNEDVMRAYQAFGDLYISLPGHDFKLVTDYSRELDLGEGIGRVSYRKDGVTYRREYFCSQPAQVLVIHLITDKPGAYTAKSRRPQPSPSSNYAANMSRITNRFSVGSNWTWAKHQPTARRLRPTNALRPIAPRGMIPVWKRCPSNSAVTC